VVSAGRAVGTIRSTKRHDYHPPGSYTMRFPKQFFGGVLVGLAFGILLGAALVEGKKDVNYSQLGGVGAILAIVGVATARAGSPWRLHGGDSPRS
jgi:hypothetical protein